MITYSIVVMFGLGLAASVILAVASKLLAVEEDPRVEAVLEALPGANCGGCGFAGCESYAAAAVNDPSIPADRCCAGGPDVSAKVAALTGKAAGSAEPMVAFRRCAKTEGKVARRYDYQGVPSCAAAKQLGSPDACGYSCIGLGDCMRACPFDAMYMAHGMVHVIREKCTACGNCVRTCPNGVMEIVPHAARVMVLCSSQDKGKAVSDVCEAGCISCMKCIKECPAKCVKLEGGVIRIDHAACLSYGPECQEVCAEKCPRNILRRLGAAAQAKQEKAA
ncbi:MAG: RnfABCDGE type electron transport complex subunit B [Thermodesulfobacteriota bacterium]